MASEADVIATGRNKKPDLRAVWRTSFTSAARSIRGCPHSLGHSCTGGGSFAREPPVSERGEERSEQKESNQTNSEKEETGEQAIARAFEVLPGLLNFWQSIVQRVNRRVQLLDRQS